MKIYKLHLDEVSTMNASSMDKQFREELNNKLLMGESFDFRDGLKIETEIEGENKGLASFLSTSSLWRKDIVDLLVPLVGEQVQFLPVQHPEYDYFLMNILNIVDRIDHSQSISERSEILDFIRYYKRYVFDTTLYPYHVFRIPELEYSIFVSEAFVNIILENGIKGMLFELLYDSETWQDPNPKVTAQYHDFITKHIEVGTFYKWEEVVEGLQDGKAYASAHWKVQLTQYGDRIFGQLRSSLDYHFFIPTTIPQELFALKWYETERTDI
ncbi:imm11 family protein [Paenibacillus campi]|uniref:imm11 family protein n=1 Tax=Paenibacillus campi TaxID=3106031 RepID=UPI002AFEE06C|nr:DUF1629 domain-containing protein [Paenibacillus sp. SGZ-1014]